MTLSAVDAASAVKVLQQLKTRHRNSAGTKNFLIYEVIDGGNLSEFQLLMGFASFEEFGRSENILEEIHSIERDSKVKAFGAIRSETLTYRADMSLFGGP